MARLHKDGPGAAQALPDSLGGHAHDPGHRKLGTAHVQRLVCAMRAAVCHDAALFHFLESNAQSLSDASSSASSVATHRLGELAKQRRDPAPSGRWEIGEFGRVLIDGLVHADAPTLDATGFALDITYVYLAGRLSISQWDRVLRLLDRLVPPAPLTGLERRVAQRASVGNDRSTLIPVEIGRSQEIYHLDHALYRHAALLLEARSRILPQSAPVRLNG